MKSIAITGIGWITRKAYGCVVKKQCRDYADIRTLYSNLQKDSVFVRPVKNFGRFDTVSKKTCCAVALSLYDAEMQYYEGKKQDIGIIGTNSEGCLQANIDYFKDYVTSGRVLARGNLFTYTLPSSPLADVAIHFRCQGPLLHVTFIEKETPALLEFAGKMILRGETSGILAVRANETEAVCFVIALENHVSSKKRISAKKVMEITSRNKRLDAIIEKLYKREDSGEN